MILIKCCLERDNYKVLEFNVNDSSYFETSASLF